MYTHVTLINKTINQSINILSEYYLVYLLIDSLRSWVDINENIIQPYYDYMSIEMFILYYSRYILYLIQLMLILLILLEWKTVIIATTYLRNM